MSAMMLAIVLAVLSVFTCSVSAQSYGFQAILTSYGRAGGTAHAYLDVSAHKLVVAAQWNGLSDIPTAMHIHGCLPAPATLFNSSSPVIDLSSYISQYGLGSAPGQVLATFDLTNSATFKWGSSASAAAQEQKLLGCLMNGTAYFNVHTSMWPKGELSGMFQQTALMYASWNALSENPAVNVSTSATGSTILLYNANTHEVFIGANFNGLTSNSTKIHWHGCSDVVGNSTGKYVIKMMPANALAQTSAGFVNYYNLLSSSSYLDSSFINSLPSTGPQAAETALWKCIVNGSTYFNVHTGLNPNGELWGWYSIAHPIQSIIPSPNALTTYTSLLNAYAVNGGAGSPIGYAVATVDVNLRYIYSNVVLFNPGLTGAPTAAHIHGCTNASARWPFSTAGLIMPLLPNTVTGKTGEFQNVFDASRPETYSSTSLPWYQAELMLYGCLQNEQTYLNIHTAANPAGEATGVLTPSNQVIQFAVKLGASTGASGVPAAAKGQAYLLWDMAAHLLWVNVTFSGLSGANTAAYIRGCLQPGGTTAGPAIPLNPTLASSGQILQAIDTSDYTVFNSTFYTNTSLSPAAWFAEANLASCFFNNSLYISLHTVNNPSSNPAGEISAPLVMDSNGFVASTLPMTTTMPTTAASSAFQFTLSIVSIFIPLVSLVLFNRF